MKELMEADPNPVLAPGISKQVPPCETGTIRKKLFPPPLFDDQTDHGQLRKDALANQDIEVANQNVRDLTSIFEILGRESDQIPLFPSR